VAGLLAGAGAITGEVTDEATGKDGAGAGICADGLTAAVQAADTATAQSTKALRSGKIL